MFVLWLASALIAMPFEAGGNPKLTARGVDQAVTAAQPGGNMEGKEIRFGPAASGSLRRHHHRHLDRRRHLGPRQLHARSAVPCPLVNMMLGEVSPGGVGAGLYGMLIFALLSVFIAGLMVGRTPEYLGKKIQAAEMKLVVLYILVVPARDPRLRRRLGRAGAGGELDLRNPGPHGLTEIVYASPRRPTTTARPSAASPATPTGTTRRSALRCWSAGSS